MGTPNPQHIIGNRWRVTVGGYSGAWDPVARTGTPCYELLPCALGMSFTLCNWDELLWAIAWQSLGQHNDYRASSFEHSASADTLSLRLPDRLRCQTAKHCCGCAKIWASAAVCMGRLGVSVSEVCELT